MGTWDHHNYTSYPGGSTDGWHLASSKEDENGCGRDMRQIYPILHHVA